MHQRPLYTRRSFGRPSALGFLLQFPLFLCLSARAKVVVPAFTGVLTFHTET